MKEATIWIYGAIATACIVGGLLLTFPAPRNREMAGGALVCAGLQGALRLMREKGAL